MGRFTTFTTKRDALLAQAVALFRPAAAEHGLTLHDVGPGIYEGFRLFDGAAEEVLRVYPKGWSSTPRLEAEGRVLPARRHGRGRVTHSLWRGSAQALLDACQPYLRQLSHVERFERTRRTFMSRYNMPVYRGPQYANPTFTEMKAAMIGSYRTAEDIAAGHAVTENLTRAHERELSDELMYWLIDTSFTPELERAKALDAEATK